MKIKKLFDNVIFGGLIGIGGFLWRLGGKEGYSKLYRRLGVSLILTLQSYLLTKNFWSILTLPIAFIVFTQGYGLPEIYDAGSRISRFVCKLLHLPKYYTGNYDIYTFNYEGKVRYLTRFFNGLSYGLAYIPTAIILGKYLNLGIMVANLSLIIPTICNFKLKDYVEEVLIGASIIAGLLIFKF